jgi:hypothetical protein
MCFFGGVGGGVLWVAVVAVSVSALCAHFWTSWPICMKFDTNIMLLEKGSTFYFASLQLFNYNMADARNCEAERHYRYSL